MNKGKLENYLIVILSIGLIIYIVWKLDIIGTLGERKERREIETNVEAWTKDAKENLKEDFVFMEGESHFFVKGNLVSKCTELDPNSHCPISLRGAKINGNNLFVGGFNFATPTLDIYPYPITEGINILGFLGKDSGRDISLGFEILDYIPNTTLCKIPHDKQQLCNIKWTKKIFLNKPVLAESLPVKITDSDYSFLDKELKVSLKGEVETKKKPETGLALYSVSESKKFLIDENELELNDENGIYIFEFNDSFRMPRPEQSYSVLLLMRGENSFYAKEWVFENGEVVNTIIYE